MERYLEQKLKSSLIFWKNFKKFPDRYITIGDTVSYFQISAFIRAYIGSMDIMTSEPFYFKFKCWFVIKHQWPLNHSWDAFLYHFYYKKDELKSLKKILREIVLFITTEISIEAHPFNGILGVEKENQESLQLPIRQKFDIILLDLSRFQLRPFAFMIHPPSPELNYQSILSYLVGTLYGMSHFSERDYTEKFRKWLFDKYNQMSELSWERYIYEILAERDPDKTISIATEEIILFIKNEINMLEE